MAGVCGFLLSSVVGYYGPLPLLRGARFTVGASASIFGLLGALVHYGRKSGSSLIQRQAKQYALFMFVFGFVIPGIDNFAHAGGFVGGYAMSTFFNPADPRTRRPHADGCGLSARHVPRHRRLISTLRVGWAGQPGQAGEAGPGYFLASSSSITRLKTSNGWAPLSGRPLMKKAGVPLTPTALPAAMSASTSC